MILKLNYSLDMINLKKIIVEKHGNMDENALADLAEQFPNAQVVIKWGMRQREQISAKDAIAKIKAEKVDYVREVFFSATDCDKLNQVLHFE
jgi:hypothetical protein